MTESTLKQFYKDKTIFITGGSGFMGKVLLEKLLYACSDLKTIYVLIRPKKGKSPESRIEDMLKIPLFTRIRDEKPEVISKLKPIQGDVTFDGLGISDDQSQKLFTETNIVFHCAATLRLEANLKDAIDMNTSGTQRVLNFCKKMQHLDALLHLSTTFCNCDQFITCEKVYECPHKPEDLMRCTQWMDEKTLELITPSLIAPHPNTYTYSKRLAECLVRDAYPSLPVAIIRPSIVCPAYEEPLEGWVDSLNGPIGVMVGAGKGVIRSMLCDGTLNAEVIPVDIAINGLIAIGWKVSTMSNKPKDIPVYNMTCSESKRVTWSYILDVGRNIFQESPFEAGLWYPDGQITTNKLWHTIIIIFCHWLPAYFIDFIMLLVGQKRFMLRVQRKVSDGLDALQFFTTRQWDFKSYAFQAIQNELPEVDQKQFNMESDHVDNELYMKRSILGGRQYCLKEPLSTLNKARRQLKFLYVLDRTAKAFLLGFLVYNFLSFAGLWDGFKELFRRQQHDVEELM